MKNLINILIFLLFVLTTKTSSQYSVTHIEQTQTSLTLTLKYIGSETYYVKPTSPIIKNALFQLKALTYYDFQFKIIDADKQRFEIPNVSPFPVDPLENFSFPLSAASYAIQFTENPFDFKITRRSNKAILFSTYEKKIVFSDYYLQIGSQLQSQYLFGLGQRLSQGFKVKNGQWTMFNRDRGDEIDTGIGLQTYGYFPFYLMRQRENNFHIAYFQTSSALDAIKEQIQNKHFLTWKLIGGIINLRFFIADKSPQTALIRLHNFYGGSYLPPFWAMGYHQSRWGYKDIFYLYNVTVNFQKHGIPLDTLWSDLDYMINSQVFTIDQDKFPLPLMKTLIQSYRWMPIIDPGIKNSGPIYQAGLEKNAYILDANTNEPILGKMRVGRTVYPDFFHPNASIYWKEMLQRLYSKVPFSGLWIDSNQFTSFCVGRCQPPSTPSKFDYNTDLPYSPGADDLEGDTISLNSTHYGSLIEADVHIYNGFLQTKATFQYLQSKGIWPFILTRSSILGSSQWSIHWSGDNQATYQFLRTSIADNLNSQLFGFQVTGADICGFGSDSNAQLCARWYQLGSLYPFCRNHNERGAIDQQPYALGQPTLSSARNNIKLRYSLLKHFYSVLLKIDGKGGFWRPLFFDFATDSNVYSQSVLDTQFLIGEQLMAAPILQPSVTSRKIYFPESNWYHYETGKKFVHGVGQLTNNKPSDLVPLFIRQGYGIMVQDVITVQQTKDLDNRFILVAGLLKDQKRTNKTNAIFTAKTFTLAVDNYSEIISAGRLQLCKMNLQLTISKESKSLKINYQTSEVFQVQEVVISKVRLFTVDDMIDKTLQKQVKIKGTGQVSIDLSTNLLTVEE